MSKVYFLKRMLEECGAGDKPLSVLDLGCGTARYAPELLKTFPQLQYTGLEPNPNSFRKAQEYTAGFAQVKLFNQFGYDAIGGVREHSYDIVFSMSVLEHVKDLDKFIAMSAKYVREGGHVVHRYDLGHALYPGSLKERLQAFLGNTFPKILPQHKFVRYVPLEEVVGLMETELGEKPYRISFHALLGTKRLYDQELGMSAGALEELAAWEFDHMDEINQIPLKKREYLFPSVAVWCKKGRS